MTRSVTRCSAVTLSLTFQERFSRRFSSRSTASRMKSACFSPSPSVASILASVPSGNLATVCSWLICFLPMLGIIDAITYCYKPQNTCNQLLPHSE